MSANSTVLRRQIGRTFRRLRREANLTVQQAADRAEMGKSTISRIEEGADTVRFKDRDVDALLKVYNPTSSEYDIVLAMTREARNSKGNGSAWWQSYATTELPRGFSLMVRLEPSAETIAEYEPELIPSLMQTRSYVESLFSVRQDDQDVQPLIDMRIHRQAIWDSEDAPRFDVVLNEAVLRRPIGGPSVMAEQLARVLELSERDNMSVRILPFRAGAYLGIGTPFLLLTFPEDAATGEPIEPPLVYVDTFGGGLALNEEADVIAHRSVWEDVSQRALDEDMSRTWITEAMKEYRDA
jgi:transcriptional regulator with XRE-family HTH domain